MDRTLERSTSGAATGAPLIQAAHWIAFIYPLLLGGALYGAWLSAWVKLGHPPRASLDDPAETLGVLYYATGLPLLGLPVAAGVAVVSIVLRLRRPRSRFAESAASFVVASLWVAVIVLLRSDPLGVGAWWMD